MSVSLLLFPALCLSAQESGQKIRLDLRKCIEIAVTDATAVVKTQNNLELAGTQVLQRYAQFLPNLQLGASYFYTTGTTIYTFSVINVLNQQARNGSFDLNSTLNLFNGLSDYAGLKSALARQNSTQLSLIWAKQQVALDVTQSYLQIVLDQLLLEIARKNLAASQARLKLLQGQTQVGSASLADFYRQKAQTSLDELNMSTYLARVRDDQINLIRKLRVDPKKEYEFETPPLESKPLALARTPMDDLLKEALRQRSDVRSNQYAVESTDWNVTQAKSGYFPRLDLSFDRLAFGQYLIKQDPNGLHLPLPAQQALLPQLGNQVNWTITLGLTWNLFDRFITKQNVAQSRTTWENTQVDYKDSQLQTQAEVKTALNDYQIALQQIGTARTSVLAAQQAYDAISGRYSVGQSSFIDVLTSQSTLVQAQSTEAQAIVNLKLREKTLEYTVGKMPF